MAASPGTVEIGQRLDKLPGQQALLPPHQIRRPQPLAHPDDPLMFRQIVGNGDFIRLVQSAGPQRLFGIPDPYGRESPEHHWLPDVIPSQTLRTDSNSRHYNNLCKKLTPARRAIGPIPPRRVPFLF
ncbi:MAG: hypothetical protein IPK83_08525 [Planctomycetes bacterium]|nr:hypothetical protein [Planctomycetota bacterium]